MTSPLKSLLDDLFPPLSAMMIRLFPILVPAIPALIWTLRFRPPSTPFVLPVTLPLVVVKKSGSVLQIIILSFKWCYIELSLRLTMLVLTMFRCPGIEAKLRVLAELMTWLLLAPVIGTLTGIELVVRTKPPVATASLVLLLKVINPIRPLVFPLLINAF